MNNLLQIGRNFYRYLQYQFCLIRGRPYFGVYLAARQGDARRIFYMDKTVEQKCRNKPKDFALSILEIGSWAGSSAIVWAEAIKKYNNGNGHVTCVDPWKSYFSLEKNQENIYKEMDQAVQNDRIYKLFLHNIKTTKNDRIVAPLRGKSSEILPSLKNKRFDIIYIDGSHSYQDVLIDLNHSMNLIGENGILCGDDLELQIQEIDLINARKNKDIDYILDPKTKKYFHPGVTLAVGETFQNVSSWEGYWAVRKKNSQWEPVNLNL